MKHLFIVSAFVLLSNEATAQASLGNGWNLVGTNGITAALTSSNANSIFNISPPGTPATTLKVYGKAFFSGYGDAGGGAANVNAYSMEIAGPAPSQTNGQATLFLHHNGNIAHQLRYTQGSLYLEAAGNGYGTSSTPNFFVGGRVTVGTTTSDATLTVNGDIHAKEVRVNLSSPGPDYVFEKDYNLPSLETVKSFIKSNKHLPEVPSADEMEVKGINSGEMDMLLLKKIEELTLYVIDLKEQNDKQASEIDLLKKQVNK